jgi:hypothetical protein
MPAVGYGQGAQANRGPYTSGGYGAPGSGGYGAQGSGGYGTPGSGGVVSTGDRGPLLIAIGVIAAVLIVVLAIVISQGGGDDDPPETGSGGTTGTGETTGEGYSAAVESQFVNACAAAEGADESNCQCVYDEIAASVPFEDFIEYDSALGDDPDAPRPSWLSAAIETCVGG